MSNINEPQYYILHETVENFTLCEREKIPSCLSHSCPSLSQEPPADISNFPRSPSLPTMKLQGSFKEFTPDFTDDEGDGIYWFRCSSPGLYQCRESGLVFDMRGEGDVSYRIVPWDRRLLSQHVRRSYGPTRQNLSPKELLEEIRSSFIDRISESVLKKLQDKMLEKKVLNDSEREDVEAGRTKRDKARVLVDTVRNKGDAASSEMIRSLCVLDPYLSGDLKLM
uniref:Caspase recruitment domain-containing protein 8-like n=1 Tax=Cyprinodon variegatus TaxID=28743 RepID=A0A3Q2DCP8_CYPVA